MERSALFEVPPKFQPLNCPATATFVYCEANVPTGCTTTVCVAVPVFPAASVAEYVTVYVPARARLTAVLALLVIEFKGIAPSMLSEADLPGSAVYVPLTGTAISFWESVTTGGIISAVVVVIKKSLK